METEQGKTAKGWGRVRHAVARRARDAWETLEAGPLPRLPMRAYQRLERRRGPRLRDLRDIPVVINNFNRHAPLRKLLDWLEGVGMRRVTILDNASTYPPTLAYYEESPHQVLYQGYNGGPYGFFRSRALLRFWGDYYIFTDPDVVPVDGLGLDAIERLYDALRRYPTYGKVGLGLKIDDLPEHYEKRDEVIAWERQYWTKQIAPDLYEAPVDTTFALYRPYAHGGFWLPALRTGGQYQARHLPWYEDSAHPSEEDEFYRATIRGDSHWMGR